MADKPTTPPKTPEKPNPQPAKEPKPQPPPKLKPPPKPRTNLLGPFLSFARRSPGFQLGQLVALFSVQYRLTDEELKILKDQIVKLPPKKLPPEKPPEKPTPPKPPIQPTTKPDLIIERTPYPKWWKDARAWNIDISDVGTHVIIRQTPGWRSYISTIVLTVDGETNITFGMGVFGSSGSMDFGGTDEPRGMVIAFGNSPLPCGEGGFTITIDGVGVHVGGFISYFYEKE